MRRQEEGEPVDTLSRLSTPLQSTVAMACSTTRLLETGLSWEFAMPSIVSSPAPPGISSDRICAVRFSVDDGNSSLVSVIGVYMPCSDQGLECYRDHLIELERVISESSLLGSVVVLGDFNAHLQGLVHWGELRDWMTQMCKVFW